MSDATDGTSVMDYLDYVHHNTNCNASPSALEAANTSDTNLLPCASTMFFFIIYGPLFGIICLFGVIGNCLAFAVLHRYAKNNVANFQLKALAVTDNIFLLIVGFAQMYSAMLMSFGLVDQLLPVFPYLQTYIWPLSHMAQLMTVWMMVVVAANRYIAVCNPLHAPRLCTMYRVKLQISIMLLLVVLYNTPRFFEFQHEWVNITLPDNTTRLEQHNTGLQRFLIYNIVYENVAYLLVYFLVPLSTLVVLNTHLVRELRRAASLRGSLTARATPDENNVTLVMIVIIVVFIVCQSPGTLNQFLYYVVSDEEKAMCSNYNRYFHISNLLVFANSSLNFLIYCLFRRQFQQDFIDMMFCRKRTKKKFTRALSYVKSTRLSPMNDQQDSHRSCSVANDLAETHPLRDDLNMI